MSNALYLLLSAIYFVWFNFVVGVHLEHLVCYLMATMCYFKSIRSRRVLLAALPYLIYIGLYDSMRAFPSYTFTRLKIRELYELERQLFGIPIGNMTVTLNEYFANNLRPTWLVLISGAFYINWLTCPLLFAIYLYRTDKSRYLKFSISFLVVNVIGFIVYYLYPAAPPWYVQLYGFEKNINTLGNPAVLSKADEFIQVAIFQRIYSRSTNVFASMPSLHAAYPALCLLFAIEMKHIVMCWLAMVFTLGIWFSAVYTCHHYFLDIIAGAACTMLGYAAVSQVTGNRRTIKTFNNMVKSISP